MVGSVNRVHNLTCHFLTLNGREGPKIVNVERLSGQNDCWMQTEQTWKCHAEAWISEAEAPLALAAVRTRAIYRYGH